MVGRAIVPEPAMTTPSTHIRSTVISASLQAIRKRGLYDRYLSLLPAEFHEPILGLVAAEWVPIELGLAHYGTLDQLGLSAQEQFDIGYEVGSRIHEQLLGTVVRLAREAGASPWTALTHLPQLWSRMFRGGSTAVYQLGPKDARMILTSPLARFAYCRNGWNGIAASALSGLCRKVYVNPIVGLSDSDRYVANISWA